MLTPVFASSLERQVLLTVKEVVANVSQLDFLALDSGRTVERFYHTLYNVFPNIFL